MHPPPHQRLLRQRFSRLRLCRLQHHHLIPKTSYIVRGQGATPALDPPRAACAATPCTCTTTAHLTPKTSDKTRGCAAHVRQLTRDCLGLGPQLRHLRVADARKLLLQSAAAAREGRGECVRVHTRSNKAANPRRLPLNAATCASSSTLSWSSPWGPC